MTTAKELDDLHNRFNKLKEDKAKTKGSMTTTEAQLKKFDIKSIEEADTFIKDQSIKKEKAETKLQDLIKRIKRLLKS